MQAEAGTSLIDSQPVVAATTAEPVLRGSRRSALLLLSVAVCVYVLDRLTKTWALANLVPAESRPWLGDILKFRLIFNSGAAFSLGTGATPVFTLAMVAVSVAVVIAATRVGSTLWGLALGLVLGGATGNLTDRLTRPPGFGRGHVVDFLELPNWPIFNIADAAIVTAAAGVALLSLRNVPFGSDSRAAPVTQPGDSPLERPAHG